MTDVHDAWLAAQADPLDGLEEALDAFRQRGTPTPGVVEAVEAISDRASGIWSEGTA